MKSKCLNAKTTPFCALDFELDLTFEPWHLTLLGYGCVESLGEMS